MKKFLLIILQAFGSEGDIYTLEWEDWSTNPLKEKAIKYYGMEELIKT